MNIKLRLIDKYGVCLDSIDCTFEMIEDTCLIKPIKPLTVNTGESLEIELVYTETDL